MLADADILQDDGRQDDARGGTAIQKAVRLMQVMLASDQPQPLTELADQLALPKPSVHRLISQLEEVGMIQRDFSGRGYTVGPTWLRLAVDALAVRARQPPVRAIMRRLVDTVQESCNLSILQEHEVLYIERVECDWPLRMQLHAGSRVPAHCTASGKLLLAFMSARNRRKLIGGLHLKRYTGSTITDADSLEAECKAIRERGISINNQEYHLGLIGVAVPVLRQDGTVVAALAIHAPSFRMSVETALSQVTLLKQAAAEIADESGLV